MTQTMTQRTYDYVPATGTEYETILNRVDHEDQAKIVYVSKNTGNPVIRKGEFIVGAGKSGGVDTGDAYYSFSYYREGRVERCTDTSENKVGEILDVVPAGEEISKEDYRVEADSVVESNKQYRDYKHNCSNDETCCNGEYSTCHSRPGDDIEEVLRRLRSRGIVTSAGNVGCGRCGGVKIANYVDELEDEGKDVKGVCWYTSQNSHEHPCFNYNSFDEELEDTDIAEIICDVLEEVGVGYVWEGVEYRCVCAGYTGDESSIDIDRSENARTSFDDGDGEESEETVMMTDGGEDEYTDDEDDIDESDFEVIRRNDYPEEEPSEKIEVEKDGYTVTIEHDGRNIRASVTGKYDFSSTVALDDDDEFGLSIRTWTPVELNGERQNVWISIPDEVYERLDEFYGEYAEWLDRSEEWIAEQPLRFVVEEHEYKTGTWRTKYQQSATVLKPNKREDDMSHSQMRVYEALREEFGGADGYPDVGDEDDFETGEVYSAGELEARVEEIVDGKIEEEREKERWSELCEEHPGLATISSASPAEVEEAFDEARRTGERVEIVVETEYCDGSVRECDIDNVRYYATPEGDVEKKRIHTH